MCTVYLYLFRSLPFFVSDSHRNEHLSHGSRANQREVTWHSALVPFAYSIYRFNQNIKHISQIGSLASASASACSSVCCVWVCVSEYIFSFHILGLYETATFCNNKNIVWKQRWRGTRDEIDQWCVNQTMWNVAARRSLFNIIVASCCCCCGDGGCCCSKTFVFVYWQTERNEWKKRKEIEHWLARWIQGTGVRLSRSSISFWGIFLILLFPHWKKKNRKTILKAIVTRRLRALAVAWLVKASIR